MTKSIKREEYTFQGRRVILDTSLLDDGNFETMLVWRANWLDIASATAATEAEALEQFDKILAAYPADKKPSAPF